MTKFKIQIFILGFFLLGVACQKKEIKGPTGDPGAPGVGGNSTINTSGIFAIAATEWQPNNDSTIWSFVVDMPQITAEIATNGVVKVFVQEETAWWELPYLAGDHFMQFGFSIGKVKISFLDPHGEKIDPPPTSNYRISTISESARMALPKEESESTSSTLVKAQIN